jgi:diadenosine tetraphosphate (Ap4A) HIT family hydrolase
MDDCFACALAAGRKPLPGGLIYRTDAWLVEHCIGPLGLGTLIVKPERHVTVVADLTPAEAAELDPLLQRASSVVGDLVDADQIYNCLWWHSGGVPVHIHYVIQPVSKQLMARYESHGPYLQAAMFRAGVAPDPRDVASVADRARQLFAARQ